MMRTEDHAFFKALGARIAQWRREQGITQVQFAEILGVSQQAVDSYERAERRVSVSMLPVLAKTLAVSLEELIGTPAPAGAKRRGPPPKLLQQIERIQRLPKTQQRFIMQVIDAMLAQQERGAL
jgi:transcriptional regulator with XRE-family HTH domain